MSLKVFWTYTRPKIPSLPFKENFQEAFELSLPIYRHLSDKDVEYGEIHRFNIPYDHCDILKGQPHVYLPDIVLADDDENRDYIYGEACNFIDYITLSVGGTGLYNTSRPNIWICI